MAIFIMYFYAMNLWAAALAHQISPIALTLFILLPLLPGIPIGIWYVTTKHPRSYLHHLQKILLIGAGQDELLVRELEKQKSGKSEPNDSAQ